MEYEKYKMEQRKQAIELASDIADFVNKFDTKEAFEVFAEKLTTQTHRTLQQSTMRMLMVCIEKWAEMEKGGYYDARNEGTVKLAKEIMDIDEFKRHLPFI